MGLVKSEQWRRLPAEGLYQIVISEVLDNGKTYPLDRSGGRAFSVTSVLDLGLRMMESERGRTGTFPITAAKSGADHVEFSSRELGE